jgi:hypothetical protein
LAVNVLEVTITEVVIENLDAVASPEITTGEAVKTKLEAPVFFKTKDLENLFPLGTVPKSVKSVSEGVVSPFEIMVLFPFTSNTCEKLLMLVKSNTIILEQKIIFFEEVIFIVI